MLPFLKNKQKSSGIVQTLHRPADMADKAEQTAQDADLEICAMDILKAIKTSDIKLLSQALKSAFEMLDAAPHVEGEHIKDEY